MKDKQREVFTNLVQKELPDLIKNKSTMIADDLKLSFQLMDIDLQDKLSDDNGTVFVPVYARCLLQNIETTESVTFSLNLLKLPVYQELGFMIRGNYMQMLDSYDKASGLHTMRKVNQSNDIDKAIIQSSNFKAIGFCRDKAKFLTELKLRGRVSDAIEISPSTFLRAITGMSKDELVAKFGYTNNFVVTIFDGRPNTLPEYKHGFPVATRNDCIQATYAAIFGASAAKNADSGTISAKLTEIKKSLFNTNYFSKGEHSYQRIQYMQSFSYRAAGKVLAKDVSSNNVKIKAGTVLSAQLLRELDATELPEITVIYNDAEFTLHRFARYWFGALNYTLLEDIPECKLAANTVLSLSDIDTLNSSSLASIKVRDLDGNVRTLTRDIEDDELSIDDIFTVFDIWVGNLKGLDVYDKEFDLTNRVLYPFDKRVLDIIDSDLDSVIHRVKKAYSEKGSSTNLQEYIVSYDKDIKIDAFIDQIRSSDLKLGQMSEMCNIMSFVSKDYKSTIANLKNIDDNLVTIQDHQHGRTDPFDIPESKKLASVQYRTMNSKLNESGLITVPYLKVENGAVISEEPVYLTAIEETDRYIAEWNETSTANLFNLNSEDFDTAKAGADRLQKLYKSFSYHCAEEIDISEITFNISNVIFYKQGDETFMAYLSSIKADTKFMAYPVREKCRPFEMTLDMAKETLCDIRLFEDWKEVVYPFLVNGYVKKNHICFPVQRYIMGVCLYSQGLGNQILSKDIGLTFEEAGIYNDMSWSLRKFNTILHYVKRDCIVDNMSTPFGGLHPMVQNTVTIKREDWRSDHDRLHQFNTY